MHWSHSMICHKETQKLASQVDKNNGIDVKHE